MPKVNIPSINEPTIYFNDAMHERLGCNIKVLQSNISSAWESSVCDLYDLPFLFLYMHGDTDKRVVLGSDKPCEGVATSLRFPSQLGSFTPGNYGSEAGPPDEQPDSPIKTSPVSERIKALEALAAKEKQPDFRSDRGFSHFKDHHHEKSPPETLKSPTEKIAPTVQKKGTSANPESPESPFEVLGDLRQVNEFEETATWMKAHLPPVPDYDAVDVIKGTPASDNVTSKEEKETPVVMPDAPMTFPNVPEAFMDTPVESPKMKDKFCEEQKQTSVEEESEFDLSFLPTAYVWEQPEKSSAEPASELSSVLPASPIPPTDFVSHSIVLPPVDTDSKQDVSADKGPTSSGELEPQEATEADSSGESDDTVIEDGISVPPPSSYPTVINESTTTPTSTPSDVLTEEKETPPPRSERKLMQVPTINVIETDEPNYSEEEMEMEPEAEEDEDYEAVKDLASEAPKTPEPESDDSENEPPRTRRLETEFMEGYSPPSSPVDSDAEPSPDVSETVNRESASKPEAVLKENDEASDFSKAQSEKTQTSCRNEEPSPFIVTNEVDFPDNDDEWSDEAQDILVKTQMEQKFIEPTLCTQSKVDEKSNVATKEVNMEGVSLAKTSFMQDDIYDRQSFDYDYDASSALDDIDDQGTNDAKECFLSDTTHTHFDTMSSSIAQNDSPKDKHNMEDLISVNNDEALSMTAAQPFLTSYPQDPYSFQIETLNSINEQDFSKQMTTDIVNENMTNGNSHSGEKIDSEIQENAKTGHYVSDATSSLKSIDPDSSVSEPTDSFVDFMRECLKSKQDEEDDSAQQDVPSKDEVCKTVLPPPQSPSTMVMDLEQEQLTISALKELGSSQEEEAEEVVSLQSRVPDHDDVAPIAASIQKSSFTSVPIAACSQSSTYSKEVEAIDEWVAEAYHLAEHVLTAILTHLSGNPSSLQAVGLLTSCSHLRGIHSLTCTLLLASPFSENVCVFILCTCRNVQYANNNNSLPSYILVLDCEAQPASSCHLSTRHFTTRA